MSGVSAYICRNCDSHFKVKREKNNCKRPHCPECGSSKILKAFCGKPINPKYAQNYLLKEKEQQYQHDYYLKNKATHYQNVKFRRDYIKSVLSNTGVIIA